MTDKRNSKTSKSKRSSNEAFSVMSKTKNIFNYVPFKDNDVLHVIYTTFNIIMLLRNGTCVSWGTNRCTLGRKCADSDADSYIPYPIKFPTKIVDIACGRNHCLARGDNFKVYSWGVNSFGQLGLSGFPMTTGAVKEEPTEIQSFVALRIKQISASGNSSFAITDGGNNLYGWGDNKNGQLGINWERLEKVQTPRVIDSTDKLLNETVICQNNDGTKSFILEMFRPVSQVSQAMIFFNNKRLHYKEIELKEDKEKLEYQEEQIKKRKGIFSVRANQLDTEQILKDIDDLVNFYGTKHPRLTKTAREDKLIKQEENIKSNEKQIEFMDYLKIFSEVRQQTKDIISKKLKRETIKDFKSILDKLKDDQANLKTYLFKNYDIINPEAEHLSDSIMKSGEYLQDLEDKVYGYNLDENNILGKTAIDGLKNNVLLAKKNNILLDRVLLYSKLYYNKSFDLSCAEDELNEQNPEVVEKIEIEKQRIYEIEEKKRIEEEEEEMKNKMNRNADDEFENAEEFEEYEG